jgi:hypothetical protein
MWSLNHNSYVSSVPAVKVNSAVFIKKKEFRVNLVTSGNWKILNLVFSKDILS